MAINQDIMYWNEHLQIHPIISQDVKNWKRPIIMVDVLSPAPSLNQYIFYWRKSQYGASDAELHHIVDRAKTFVCRLLASQGIKQVPLRPAMMEPIPGKKMLMMSRNRPHDFVSTFGTSCFLFAQNTRVARIEQNKKVDTKASPARRRSVQVL